MPYFEPVTPDEPFVDRIKHTRTDDFSYQAQFQDEDGGVFDFSGMTFVMEIKDEPDGSVVVTIPDGNFTLSQSADAVAEGAGKNDVFTISHPPADFSGLVADPFEYYADIQVTDATGKKFTPIIMDFIIRAD